MAARDCPEAGRLCRYEIGWPCAAVASGCRVDATQTAALVRALKGWTFEVTGPLSWEQAQTTGGSVPLSEIDPETYVAPPQACFNRRLLDAAGNCGGYNLHWAWNTGILAGQAAVQMARRDRID